jgi:hypothetical protein
MPALQQQLGLVGQGLAAGGEPGYVGRAWEGQRTGLTEGLASQEAGAGMASAFQNKAAVAGGNQGSILGVPADYGAKLARTLVGSRVTQGLGAIDEVNKLFGMGMGGVEQAGSSALGAGQAQLGAIGMMPGYNTTTANILGAASLGGSIYGAFSGAQRGNPAAFPGSKDYVQDPRLNWLTP